MTFDALQFLKDYDIPYATEGKNTSPDFINIDCPFCNDTSNHLGFHIKEDFVNCWRCGKKNLVEVIQILLNISFSEALRIKKEYTTDYVTEYINKEQPKSKNTILTLPEECTNLNDKHKKYLIKRNFDPDYLEKEFDLKGTSFYGDYKFRIIAPIYLNRKLISFQGRDYTDKQDLRYKACPKTEEVLHHKFSLYNVDNCKRDKCVVVEGIFDCFRLGKNSTSTFGSSWTMEQAKMLTKKFKEVFIFFDKDEEAQKKAEKLGIILESSGIKSYIIKNDFIDYNDPGSMSQDEADNLMRDVFK